jgi:AcrR family transcriptional regulator
LKCNAIALASASLPTDERGSQGSQVASQSRKDDRRDKILESTWQLIARHGLAATNMRALAAEAGYANGALAYYFAGKDDLVRATYEYVLLQTNLRIDAATRGLRGLSALRAFCIEIVPDDELKLLEARVVVPFWSTALTDRTFASLFARDMSSWRKQMRKYLSEAAALGEIAAPRHRREHPEAIEALVSMLTGMQILAVLNPEQHTPRMMRKMLDDVLLRLASGASTVDSRRR